jgi:hypothetical protein
MSYALRVEVAESGETESATSMKARFNGGYAEAAAIDSVKQTSTNPTRLNTLRKFKGRF